MTAGWRPLDPYLALKFLHVAGAAILLGTGLGIAFFLFVADRAGNFEALATTLRHVVIADYVFTATAAILQPITGLALVHLGGFSLSQDPGKHRSLCSRRNLLAPGRCLADLDARSCQ